MDLEARLRYRFLNPDLLAAALDHRTFVHEHVQKHRRPPYHGDAPVNDDGQYAFLGDAVLSLALAERERRRSAGGKGSMTKARAEAAKNATLTRLAREQLGLDAPGVLRLGEGEKRNDDGEARRLADAVEAIFGALYLDAGPAHAIRVVIDLFDRFDARRP